MKTNLKIQRVNRGLTQAEIASKLGVTVQTVYLWEQGRTCVAKKHWSKLASMLRLTEDELEKAMIETILDASIAKKDARLLINAQTSRLYHAELIQDAFVRFHSVVPEEPQTEAAREKIELEQIRLELEKKILERDREILELKTQIFELKKLLSELNPDGKPVVFPHPSTSSSHHEVKP